MKASGQENNFVSERESRYLNRCLFLEIVSRVCPEFWNVLRETVLPKFPAGVSPRAIQKGHSNPAFASIAPAFSDWIERFNITDVAWLHVIALRTLRMWSEHPNLKSFDPGTAMDFTEPIHFTWDRQTESKAQFFKRVNQVGGTRRRLNKEHAQWFALYQFAGLSPANIRKLCAPNKGTDEDPSVILSGCEAVANRLGIPLRKGRRGQPRKKIGN